MSATRDPSEKISFLFTPIRAGLVRKIKESKLEAKAPLARPLPRVVREYRARELTPAQKPLPAQAALALQGHDNEATQNLAGLRKSLGELETLQKRFRFLLQELEDLIQD